LQSSIFLLVIYLKGQASRAKLYSFKSNTLVEEKKGYRTTSFKKKEESGVRVKTEEGERIYIKRVSFSLSLVLLAWTLTSVAGSNTGTAKDSVHKLCHKLDLLKAFLLSCRSDIFHCCKTQETCIFSNTKMD